MIKTAIKAIKVYFPVFVNESICTDIFSDEPIEITQPLLKKRKIENGLVSGYPVYKTNKYLNGLLFYDKIYYGFIPKGSKYYIEGDMLFAQTLKIIK